MANKNTLGKIEYLLYSLGFPVWFWVLYQNIFFRCLPGTTASTSRLILGVLTAAATAIGYGMTARKRRNFFSATINAMLPFSLYWLVTYHQTYPLFSVVVVVMTTLLPLVYFVIAIGIYFRVKVKKACKTAASKAIWLSFLNARTVAILCLGIVFTTGISTLFGFPLLQASTKAAAGNTSANEFTIESETGTLLTLSDGTWEQSTNTDKLNVLQTVANIEAAYLGIPHELNVAAAALRDGVVGAYSDSSHSILIDIDSLENDSAYDLLDTVLHEARHSYQHNLVSLYQVAAPEYRQLLALREAEQYFADFSDYTHGSPEEMLEYYSQACEEDARAYADDRLMSYLYYIIDFQEVA